MPSGRFPGQSTTGTAAKHDCTPGAATAPGPGATAVTTRLVGLETRTAADTAQRRPPGRAAWMMYDSGAGQQVPALAPKPRARPAADGCRIRGGQTKDMALQLAPGEPEAEPWRTEPLSTVIETLARAGPGRAGPRPSGRPGHRRDTPAWFRGSAPAVQLLTWAGDPFPAGKGRARHATSACTARASASRGKDPDHSPQSQRDWAAAELVGLPLFSGKISCLEPRTSRRGIRGQSPSSPSKDGQARRR